MASIKEKQRTLVLRKAGTYPMSIFEDWARATFRQANIEVNDEDVALVKLVYGGALHQLEMLDRIDLDAFPARGIDLRHAPKAT